MARGRPIASVAPERLILPGELPTAPNDESAVVRTLARLKGQLPAAPNHDDVVAQVLARLATQLPPAPNTTLIRKEFPFTGAWNPTDDPLLIGEQHYADLQNFRYKDRSLITVLGYTRINTVAHGTYTRGRSGIHFLKSINSIPTSFVLAQVENAGLTASAVLQHTTAIPSQGNFAATALYTDGAGAGLGRFSLAPDQNVAYANGVASLIWGSSEHRCAAFIVTDTSAAYYRDFLSAVTNTLTTAGNVATIFLTAAIAPFILIGSTRPLQGFRLYVSTANTAVAAPGALTAAINVAAGNLNGAYTWRVTFVNADGETEGGTISNSITPVNQQADLTGIPTGPSGTTARRLYRPVGGGSSYLRVTELGDNVTTTYTDNIADGALGVAMPTTNSAGVRMAVDYWGYTGGWNAVTGLVDGTAINGRTLAQTGNVTFDSTDIANARVRVEGEVAFYFYRVRLTNPVSSGTAVSHCTLNAPFQTVKDVWDGIYRRPIGFFRVNAGANADFTLEVSEESSAVSPIAAELGAIGAGTANHVLICFSERQMAIKWKMVADRVNTVATSTTVDSWDGNTWFGLPGLTDGTAVGGVPLARTGTMWWRYFTNVQGNDDDVPQTLYGITGYWYRVYWLNPLSATVDVDAIYGIPVPRGDLPACRFPFQFQNRLFLMGDVLGNEGHAAEFCRTGAPDVWNGDDSSAEGQRLYFGTGGDLMAAVELYNRFAGTLQYVGVVCKLTETLLFAGNDPASFSILPISKTIGCPAPLTMDTAEVNYSVAEDAQRNVAMWLSANGPVIFDGSVLIPVPGLEPYFDPNDARYITTSALENARGWFSTTNGEPKYVLLLPTAGTTTCNVKLVYDLKRKKWYREVPPVFSQMGVRVHDAQGRPYIYGWRDDVGLMMRLENGFTWDGTAISALVDLADLLPTQSGWDISRLRHVKLLARRTTAAIDAVVTHFADGASGGTTLQTFDLETGAARYRRMTGNQNVLAYSHQLRVAVTTSTEQVELLGWGALMELVREDI